MRRHDTGTQRDAPEQGVGLCAVLALERSAQRHSASIEGEEACSVYCLLSALGL